MGYLIIQNDGLIEIGALTLIGVSVKNQNSIGFFGSGNKYAIATLLRNKIGIKIYSGIDEVTIGTSEVCFRGETFDQIIINGRETGFTTRMGPKWKVWYAIREIYCNALDEGCAHISISETVKPSENVTTFAIEISDDIKSVIEEWDNYFCSGINVIYKSSTHYGDVSILEGSGDGSSGIFRKSIRSYDHDKKSLFRYNFDTVEINESRIINADYLITERIASAFAVCDDEDVIRTLLPSLTYSDNIENELKWDYVMDAFSDSWSNVLEGKKIVKRSVSTILPACDLIGTIVLQDSLFDKLKQQFPSLLFYPSRDIFLYEDEPSEELMECFSIAMKNLSDIGIETNVKFSFVKMKDKDHLACYCYDSGEAFISVDHPVDAEEMESTIYEEVSHSEGFEDCSRIFENHLMKKVISLKKQIASIRNQ